MARQSWGSFMHTELHPQLMGEVRVVRLWIGLPPAL